MIPRLPTSLHRPLLLAALLGVMALPAQAACYADYKAKQDNPLRLHYGIVELPDSACTPAAAKTEIERRLSGSGWTLLNVLSIFGSDGLAGRKADAGSYFLRF
jgi:hypothetical protein